MASVPNLRTSVLLRSEQSGGQVSMIENVIPAQSAGPPPCTRTTSTRRSTCSKAS